jgi:hypothetical protein
MNERVAVIDQNGKPLMPTKASRARRWEKQGLAERKWSDLGVPYFQLKFQSSSNKTQPIVVGVDPGKSYSGVGVQSEKFTLLRLHLVLPFNRVRARMDQRRLLRRSRRGRRINRKVPFALRNHRQKRFDNRRSEKLAPSIRAARQLEIRVVRELATIYPLTSIVYERVRVDVDQTSGRKGARSGRGFSAVMVGQNWTIAQLSGIAPVQVREGWQADGNGTSQLRTALGLIKDKINKSDAKPDTHAVDGVALACGQFIQYRSFQRGREQGHEWIGSVQVTDSRFKIITRFGAVKRGKEYGFFRRQLHFEVPDKSGNRKRKGGTVTPFGLRVGDFVSAEKSGVVYQGYVGGYTDTDKTKLLSVYDWTWKRLGQFSVSKVKLLRRSNGLCVA